MKKQLLTILAMGAMGSMFAQLPASTTPQNKKAVLEEYTGVYCGYCPDGHRIATNIYNADPTNVVLINIHSGSFANVNTGEPDFKTAMGTAIDGMPNMLITGYPAGDVNRTVFAGASQTLSGMAEGRGSWTNSSTTIKTQAAYCNVAVQGTVDAVTRVLTVQAQVYYTGNSPAGTNSLTVMLLEDGVIGPQHNYGATTFGPSYYNYANYNVVDQTYNHHHLLRAGLTPNFGVPVSPTTMGSTFNQTFTMTIPATYGAAGKTTQALLGRLQLAAFVTESNTLTINGNYGPITIVNNPITLDIGTPAITTEGSLYVQETVVCTALLNPSWKFVNYGSTPVTQAVFSYNVNGGTPLTYTWTGSLGQLDQSKPIAIPTISFAPIANNTLNITVLTVNGVPDPIPGNNTWTKTVPMSTMTSNTLAMKMDFNQDQYGTEDSWVLTQETTGTIISSDGPWSNLSAAGTLLHTKTFTVNPNLCYKLVVKDSYGDGVNSGYGVGGYTLTSGSTAIYTSNGMYGTGETNMFKTASTTGINAAPVMNISGVNVYPNPAANSCNVNIEMSQNETINMVVVNSIGQVVHSETMSLDAGSNDIKMNTENWASGLYNISLSTSKGSTSVKLTVAK
jgi:hypothetical protein